MQQQVTFSFLCEAESVNPLGMLDKPVCSMEKRRRAGYTPVCSLLAH